MGGMDLDHACRIIDYHGVVLVDALGGAAYDSDERVTQELTSTVRSGEG